MADEVKYQLRDGEKSITLSAVVEATNEDTVDLLVDLDREDREKFRVSGAVLEDGIYINGEFPSVILERIGFRP